MKKTLVVSGGARNRAFAGVAAQYLIKDHRGAKLKHAAKLHDVEV